ncbi:MAG: hypothetical protein F4Z72_14960 [Gemmatimonadales bacterium]|nr:hypothetical protein [Candidatus Palauibacter irciniicola]MYC17021.1 hypothetical protein [Gemmatimonadales bacterium]
MGKHIAAMLNETWGVGLDDTVPGRMYYDRHGHWYNPLTLFPGALFSPRGYILFKTREEYESCLWLRRTSKVHVRYPQQGGRADISQIPGYRSVPTERIPDCLRRLDTTADG